jgi:hypothetical protein
MARTKTILTPTNEGFNLISKWQHHFIIVADAVLAAITGIYKK